MEFNVRPAESGDYARAYAIERECLDTFWSEEQIKNAAKNGNIYLVAEYGGAAAGIISAVYCCGVCEIMNLAVAPEFRRKGAAGKLLRELEKTVISLGGEKTVLEAAEDNTAALRLYERCGYLPVGRRKGFYKGTDAILMEKIL